MPVPSYHPHDPQAYFWLKVLAVTVALVLGSIVMDAATR